MLTRSLVPALPYSIEATSLFEDACRLVLDGDLSRACVTLDQIDDRPLRAHFYAVGDEWARRNYIAPVPLAPGVDHHARQKLRMPTESESFSIFEDDGWRCRWCGSRVISMRAIKRIAAACPSSFTHGKANDVCHGLTLCCGASLDHVVPHSFGGTNERENLVTACWPCQFGRGNDTIERLGLADPRQRPPVVYEWTGCRWLR